MNQFIVLIADTLHVAGENVCFSDTIICKVISPQEVAFASINWTIVIIAALVAVVLLAWIISNVLLHKEKMDLDNKSHYVDLLIEENSKKSANKEVVDLIKNLLS